MCLTIHEVDESLNRPIKLHVAKIFLVYTMGVINTRLRRCNFNYIELVDELVDENDESQDLPPPSKPLCVSPRRLMGLCSSYAMKDITSQVENTQNQSAATPMKVRSTEKRDRLSSRRNGTSNDDEEWTRIGISERPNFSNMGHGRIKESTLTMEFTSRNFTRVPMKQPSQRRSLQHSRSRKKLLKMGTIEEDKEFDGGIY